MVSMLNWLINNKMQRRLKPRRTTIYLLMINSKVKQVKTLRKINYLRKMLHSLSMESIGNPLQMLMQIKIKLRIRMINSTCQTHLFLEGGLHQRRNTTLLFILLTVYMLREK